jgi:hypothetical protein
MMDRVKLPETIQGEWIWKKSVKNNSDAYLFFRREFTLDYGGAEVDLWISAGTAYQLYINGRFVGFGPMMAEHHTAYADQYNVSYYLQSGNNAISVIVYAGSESCSGTTPLHGLWCQLHVNNQPTLWSDRTWKVLESECFSSGPRQTVTGRGRNEVFDFRQFPVGWHDAGYGMTGDWQASEISQTQKSIGLVLKISPLVPNSCEEVENFTIIKRGQVRSRNAYTFVTFNEVHAGTPGVYAAQCFMFSESNASIPVIITADDPYKFFCNYHLAKSTVTRFVEDESTASCIVEQASIPIKQGWNSLLIVQQVSNSGIGVVLDFPKIRQEKLFLLQDTIEDAPAHWNIAGPLRMPLIDATPSLKFERLYSKSFNPAIHALPDVHSYLLSAELTDDGDLQSTKLTRGQYLLYQAEELMYGFPAVEISGSAGDIVDISIGINLSQNGFPVAANGARNTHTLCLRNGANVVYKFKPTDCANIMISVRKAEREVVINRIAFVDFYRNQRYESFFRCSDDELNLIWETGKSILHRTANNVVVNGQHSGRNTFLLDSFIQSMNMIMTFGDYSLSETRLRQLFAVQFENGDIPASGGDNIKTQLSHLFFLPIWMIFHYKASGNEAFIQEMLPGLDLLSDFFETLVDENTGFMVDSYRKHNTECSLLQATHAGKHRVTTDLNCLYCRFLLSAADVYRAMGRPETALRCIESANKIAENLKKHCWHTQEKIFANYANEKGMSEERDVSINFLAIYSGVGEVESFEEIFFRYFNFYPPFSKDPGKTENSYFNFVFLETLFALNQGTWGLKYLKDFWIRRIDPRTKSWLKTPGGSDVCSLDFAGGDTITPNLLLIREAIGIRVAEPGFSTIYFNPALSSLTWAEATMHTVYGKLRIKWEILEDDSLDITIDAKFPLKVVPELPSEILSKSTFRLGENVVLLDPESGSQDSHG